MSMIAGGFANILNYGLINIPRAGMIHTWRWIFVILGVITILLGIMAFFLVVDFPYKNKFLTEEETQFVLDRVNAERGDAIPDEATGTKVLKHLLCWRTWVFGFLFLSSTLPVSSLSTLWVILQTRKLNQAFDGHRVTHLPISFQSYVPNRYPLNTFPISSLVPLFRRFSKVTATAQLNPCAWRPRHSLLELSTF